MIVFGVSAQVSITTLFMAGVLPGIAVAISLIIFAFVSAKKKKFGARFHPELMAQTDRTDVSVWKAFKNAIWAILCPVIILGGIYSGAFTPTEAAVVACIYALVIGLFVYKEINPSAIIEIFKSAAAVNGTILILVTCATAFGRVLAMAQVPVAIADAIRGVSDNPIVILLLINLVLLILGLFMETLSALIVLTPILLPIVVGLGIHPIHFGIIMTMNLAIGQSTPPAGVNTFVAARVGECKVETMFKWLLPAVGVQVIVLLILTYVPIISLALPTWLGMI
jgi:C4-dicarboxylate transporter DctM subunit